MRPAQKRLVYLALAATIVAIFCAGLLAGYIDRHTSICPDNKPPLAQQDTGLGQILFLCHNGKTVTSND